MNGSRRGTWGLIGAHLAMTVPLAVLLNAWRDECYSLTTTGYGFGRAWIRALVFEMQPPFYFLLLTLWRHLGESVVVARFLSVACVALALVVVASLARRLLPEVRPALAVALVAFNPFAIWAAAEIRLYALAIALSAVVMLTFFDGYLAEPEKLAARRLNAVLSVLALYTQYYLGFLLLAQAAGLVATRRWKRLLDYVAWMSVAGLAFAPMLLIIPAQISGHTGTVVNPLGIRYLSRLIVWRIQFFVLPAAWLPLHVQWLLFALFVAGVALALAALRRRRLADTTIALWATTAVLAISFLGVLRVTGEDLFDAKHSVALFLPSVLSVAALLVAVGRTRALAAWTALAFVFYGGMLADRYRPMAKEGDARRAAEFIMARERPDQPVLVFNPEGVAPLALYYRGPNPLVPVPAPVDPDFFDVRQLALHREEEFWHALGGPERHPTLWLVTQGAPRFLDIDFNHKLLEGIVARNFTVEASTSLYKTRVRLLRIKDSSPRRDGSR